MKISTHIKYASLILPMALAWGCTIVEADRSSDDDDGNTSTSRGQDTEQDHTSPAPDCLGRCWDKADACGAPPDVADEQCFLLCDYGPTAEELACVEASDCASLSNDDVCGIGSTPPDDEPPMASGAGDDEPPVDECIDAGDSCDPNGPGFQCEEFLCYCNGQTNGIHFSGCGTQTSTCRDGSDLCEGACAPGESTSSSSAGCG